jgi:hypothetical protein
MVKFFDNCGKVFPYIWKKKRVPMSKETHRNEKINSSVCLKNIIPMGIAYPPDHALSDFNYPLKGY